MPLKTRYTNPISLRVPKVLSQQIDKHARRLGVPKSQLWLSAMDAFLANPPKTLPVRAPQPADSETADVFE